MKFKNETGKANKIRLDGKNEYIWKTVKPGEIIDIPKGYGERLKYTPIEVDKIVKAEEPKEEIIEPESKLDEVKQDDSEDEPRGDDDESSDDFFQELNSIKGIGKKTTKDILKVYPTKDKLIEAINAKEKLPFRDDVVMKLVEAFR